MPSKKQEIIKNINFGLQAYADSNIPTTHLKYSYEISFGEYLKLHSMLSDLIDRYAPHKSAFRVNFLSIYKKQNLANTNQLYHDIQALYGILAGLKLAYEHNLLQSIEEEIHGTVFNDFLEMAEYFLSQEEHYKHPAAFLIGGVLEEYLRKLAIKNEISTIKDNNQFRHAEDLNMDLKKKGIYDENERKSITAWLGLRNDADHAHWEKYTKEKVVVMLKDVKRIISQYPA